MHRPVQSPPTRRHAALVLIIGLVLAFTSTAAPAGADTVPSATLSLVTNDPHTVVGAPSGGQLPEGQPDHSAVTTLIGLVDSTPASETIHATFWALTHVAGADMVDALTRAADRGVDVRVVLDHAELANGTHRNDPVIPELTSHGVEVTTCDNACNGSNGIAHNKFFLFSRTTDESGVARTEVVANGSQNMTAQQNWVHNNWLVSHDDHQMYTGFLRYWRALRDRQAVASNPAVSTPVGSDTGHVTTYFFPRTHDVIADFVRQLDCSRGGKIWAESATWTSDRTALNNAIMAQADAGCRVTLLMDHSNAPQNNTAGAEDDIPTGTNVFMNANAFALHGIKVYGTTPGGCRYVTHGSAKHNCHGRPGGTHDKYVIIQGVDANGQATFQAMTGSENFTRRAMTTYTDSTMAVDDPVIVQGLLDHFSRQLHQSVVINPEKYPDATYETANSASNGSQDKPSVDRVAGFTAIAWADDRNPSRAATGKHGAIWVKLLRSDGSTVYERPVQVQPDTVTGTDYQVPVVGVAADGDVIVAWQDDHDGNGSYQIVLRRIGNNNTASPQIGGRVTANAVGAGDQTAPAIDVGPDGNFAVAWTDRADGVDVRFATFAAPTQKLAEQRANGSTAGTQSQPAVAVQAGESGQWTSVVAWRDDADGNGSGDIWARAVTQTGATVWSEKRLNAHGSGDQSVPALSSHPGGFVAVWQTHTGSAGAPCHAYDALPGRQSDPVAVGTDRCVQVREFTTAGKAAAAEFEVSNGLFDTNAYAPFTELGDQRSPDVATDAQGNYVVTWQERTPHRNSWDVFARSFTAGGGTTAATLSEYRMSALIAHDQVNARVATDPTGNLIIVYQDDDDGNGSTEVRVRDGFTLA